MVLLQPLEAHNKKNATIHGKMGDDGGGILKHRSLTSNDFVLQLHEMAT